MDKITYKCLVLKKLIPSFQSNSTFSSVLYYWNMDPEKKLLLNDYLGKKIKLGFTGKIFCINCGRKTNKSFQQGYCFPCFKKLPQTDMCQVKPELCHFHLNTCRDSKWGEKNCFIKHTIYLSNTSNLKVGITRQYQEKNRWVDQGATQSIPLGYTVTRLLAGRLEVLLKDIYQDKTSWQKMLFLEPIKMDMLAEKEKALDFIKNKFRKEDFEVEGSPSWYQFDYPILKMPASKKSIDLMKTPVIEDELLGIKGQYLLLMNGVLNIRKHSGYEVNLILG